MVRSYPRNNFLDIIRDPLAVTIMASIALHAAIGAYLLPMITKTQPEGKKAEPTTVKVVQLTPNELQRIPQAPAPVVTPAPSPQVLPPVYQPSTPVAPSIPKYSTSIPISPVRTPPKKAITQPAKGTKSQPTKPQPPSRGAIFDPNAFDPVPSPKPSKSPTKKGTNSKASPKPLVTPSIKPTQTPTKPPAKILAAPKPQAATEQNTDDDGGGKNPPNTQPTTPNITQKPSATPQPSSLPIPASGGTLPTQPPANSGVNGSGFYGKYTQAANDRLLKYVRDNPGIKTYQPKLISQKYPTGVPCTTVKQPPFIVLMVAFGKVPQAQDNNVLGESTAPSIDKPYVVGDGDTPTSKKLAAFAADAALYEANKSDQTRPEADKDKSVLYQYRVQFDPATCKN